MKQSDKIESFFVIGLAVRTTNENGRSGHDIPALWNRFFAENIISKIPGKVEGTIYFLYTDYEKDHTTPYSTIIGCKVKNLNSIPEGLVGKHVKGGHYRKFTAKGRISDGVIFNEWVAIWNSGIKRAYTTDIEVWGEKSQHPDNAEIDILVALE